MLSSREIDPYAAWAPQYPPHAHNPLMEVEQAAVLELLPPVAGLTVLDAGCGTGRYARLLIDNGARRVIAVDRSLAMLTRVRVPNTCRVRADICAIPLARASCDLVVSGLTLADLPDIDAVMRTFAEVLKPGGVAVCSTLHPSGAELGWKRTFDTPEGTRVLAAHWHTLRRVRAACDAAGLGLDAWLEPCLTAQDVTGPPTPVALVVRAIQGTVPFPPRSSGKGDCPLWSGS